LTSYWSVYRCMQDTDFVSEMDTLWIA
jgi:hypothetical protein